MATKERCLVLKNDHQTSDHSNNDSQYQNINLNQFHNGSEVNNIQSESITNKSNPKLINEVEHSDTFTNERKNNSWATKTHKPLEFNNFTDAEKVVEKHSKENKTTSTSNSTLSLHIAAYENSVEVADDAVHHSDENEEASAKKSQNKALNKMQKCIKQLFSTNCPSATIFEIPRQQEDASNNTPEIMQFKASQKLLNPYDASDESKGTKKKVSTMAFWDDFEDESASLVKKLDNESVSLQAIVEDSMCLMLIRDENSKIIEYFSQPAIFRQLFHVALNTDIDNSMNDTEQYKFAYQCCEVLNFQQNKLYNAYLDDEEILGFLATFLEKEKEKMNHLTASFYARILLSLYNFDHTKVLEALSKTNFLDTALQLIKFSAIAELLYNLTTCIPLESRDGVKKYFIENDFGKKLCNSFKSSTDFIAIENTGSLWAEFIKNMRDFCYNYSRDDDLLQHLEHPDLILELLTYMFPEDKSKRDPSVIVSGCLVLMAVLDRPYDVGQPSVDLNKTEERPKLFNPDDDFKCEAICAKYVAELLDSTLEAARAHDGDVLARCMIVLEGIFNTAHTKNHAEYVDQLKKANFGQFFDFIKENPTISLLNNSIHTLVSYMLHCALSEEDHLVSYLFNDLGITSIILNALKDIPESTSNVAVFGARAFFYRLAERIAIAKEQSQNNARITKRISDLPDDHAWTSFADSKLMDYLREHSPVDLSQTRNHSMSDISSKLEISVDDVVDIGINELEPTLKAEAIRSPTAQMIENLEKLNDSNADKPDSLFERYRTEMQKDKADNDDNVDELFDLLSRPSTKVATMDVDDWPTSSATKSAAEDDDDDNEELELFKKLKPATSQPAHAALDEDWPVTTLPPALPKDDPWDDFNAISDDFPKKKEDES